MDEVDAQMPSGVYVSSLCSEGYMYDDANARPNFALCTPPSPHLPASPFPLTRPHIAPHTPRSAAFPHRPAEPPCHSTPLQPLSLVNAAPIAAHHSYVDSARLRCGAQVKDAGGGTKGLHYSCHTTRHTKQSSTLATPTPTRTCAPPTPTRSATCPRFIPPSIHTHRQCTSTLATSPRTVSLAKHSTRSTPITTGRSSR